MKGRLSDVHQITERVTPPSTRSAAPFVADESGLATNATKAATSSVVANRLRSELGRTVSKNSFSTTDGSTCRDIAICLMKLSTPSDRVGPGKIELTVTPVPTVVSASPRKGDLSCLCHAIVDHLHRDIHGGFTRDKNDSSPVLLKHSRKVVPAQPHSAQYVHFEDAHPV